MSKFISLLFSALYAYAILRYHIGKGTPWNDWFFIVNKAFAWTGFTLVTLSILSPELLRRFYLNRRNLGMSGFVFIVMHGISVLLLFDVHYYPKFYTNGLINSLGWSSISIGVLSIGIFLFPMWAALQTKPSEHRFYKLGKWGVAFSLFHPMIIGISGWFAPETWPYYLPPITLLAVITGILVLLLRVKRG